MESTTTAFAILAETPLSDRLKILCRHIDLELAQLDPLHPAYHDRKAYWERAKIRVADCVETHQSLQPHSRKRRGR